MMNRYSHHKRDGKVQKNMARLVPRTCPWALAGA